MKKKWMRAFCGGLALCMLAGCAPASQAGTGSQAALSSSSQPETPTRQVATLDKQSQQVLSQFDIVGKFHDGVAFAANYQLLKTPEELAQGYVPVECGYVTLNGTFTPLYTVPSEFELISPEEGRSKGRYFYALFLETFEGVAIAAGATEEFFQESPTYQDVPLYSEQQTMDETFAVGDNGWVPYYENGLWGYCDLEGNVTLAPAYDFVEPFYNGSALVCRYDGMYTWSAIDEKGNELFSLEPCDMFALRQPGSDFFLLTESMNGGHLYRMDGTILDSYWQFTQYDDNGSGLLANYMRGLPCVYDADGNFLYQDDRIQLTSGQQDGCTAYSDGTLFGILGQDGQVRCEARFAHILHLAPEGFYAQEAEGDPVRLYDYDGNLLQEDPACARLEFTEENGYTLYDGQGNTLEEYPCTILSSSETEDDVFFTEDGFAYLYLSQNDFAVVHVTFEAQPAEDAGTASAA